MTLARSMFTEAIEEHLALKKQNAQLEVAMPLAKYDVGDPLDRYPGGPARAVVSDDAAVDAAVNANDLAQLDATDDADRRPLEPLGGMTPLLSIVDDIDEDEVLSTSPADDVATDATPVADFADNAQVVRFPGATGPRDDADDALFAADATMMMSGNAAMTPTWDADAPADVSPAEQTGEQPVIVIDADAPLGLETSSIEPMEPKRSKRPRFFGLGGRKKKNADPTLTDSWFAADESAPKDFTWGD